MPETAGLVKRLREPIWSEDVPDEVKAAVVEAADRLEALEAALREGADVVSGTWDGIYGIDDEIAWVKKAEAVLGPASQLPPLGKAPALVIYGSDQSDVLLSGPLVVFLEDGKVNIAPYSPTPSPSVSVEELARVMCHADNEDWDYLFAILHAAIMDSHGDQRPLFWRSVLSDLRRIHGASVKTSTPIASGDEGGG